MDKIESTARQNKDVGVARANSRWYIWDVVLLGFLFLFGTFGNAMPLFSYWGGLHNSKDILFTAIAWFGVLMPVAGICLVAALIHISRYWARHISQRGRLVVLQIATILATLAYVGLPFTSVGPAHFHMHMQGLRKYTQTQVDIAAIRTWLGSLDPSDHEGVRIELRRDADNEQVPEPNEPVLPACILNLEPRFVALASVEDQGLAVALRWGSGLLGTWGMVIGPATMTGAPSALWPAPEYSLDASPGVRLWHDRD